LSESEPFYTPSDPPDHPAYRLFTGYAAKLEQAGLRIEFPSEPGLRNIAIEFLAESDYSVEDVVEDRSIIREAVSEAEIIYNQRRRSKED
jgi:hypothetical protein